MKFIAAALTAAVASTVSATADFSGPGHLELVTGDQLNSNSYVEALPQDDTASIFYAYSDRSPVTQWSVTSGGSLEGVLANGSSIFANVDPSTPVLDGIPLLTFKLDVESPETGFSLDPNGFLEYKGSVNWFLCKIDTPEHYLQRAVALFSQEPVNGKPPHDGCETAWPQLVNLLPDIQSPA